jgi:hypothetical protein
MEVGMSVDQAWENEFAFDIYSLINLPSFSSAHRLDFSILD